MSLTFATLGDLVGVGVYRGDWIAGTTYAVMDCINDPDNAGKVKLCATAHATYPPYPDEWADYTGYAIGDHVAHNGSYYTCKLSHLGTGSGDSEPGGTYAMEYYWDSYTPPGTPTTWADDAWQWSPVQSMFDGLLSGSGVIGQTYDDWAAWLVSTGMDAVWRIPAIADAPPWPSWVTDMSGGLHEISGGTTESSGYTYICGFVTGSNAVASISFDPTSCSLSAQKDASNPSQGITLNETGGVATSITAITLGDTTHFSKSGITLPYALGANGSVVLTIAGTSTAAVGTWSTTCTVSYGGGLTASFDCGLTISQTPNIATWTMGANTLTGNDYLNFGSTPQGNAEPSITVAAHEYGTDGWTITDASFSNAAFEFGTAPTFPVSVTNGGPQSFDLRAKTGTLGTTTATVTFSTTIGSTNSTFTLNLSAVTVANIPAIHVASGATALANNSTLNFGSNYVGNTASTKGITISNSGVAALSVTAVTLSDTTNYEFVSPPTYPVSVGSPLTVTIRGKTTDTGDHDATATIASNDPGGDFVVNLRSTVFANANPNILVSDGTDEIANEGLIDFGSPIHNASPLPSKVITIQNVGFSALTITNIALGSTTNFRFATTPTVPMTIAAGATNTITIQAKTNVIGFNSTTVNITNNSDNHPAYVASIQANVGGGSSGNSGGSRREIKMGYTITQMAETPLIFGLVTSTDHVTGANGKTPTVTISKNGNSFITPTGAIAEIGSGIYKVVGNTNDSSTNGPLTLHATADGCDPADVIYWVGDVWEAEMGGYISTSAGGFLDAIRTSIGQTGFSPIVVQGTTTETNVNNITIALIKGDDYTTAAGSPIQFSADGWPVLTGGSVTLYLKSSGGAVVQISQVGTITTSGTGTQTIKFELTHTQTNAIPVGQSALTVRATLSNGSIKTIILGTATVTAV